MVTDSGNPTKRLATWTFAVHPIVHTGATEGVSGLFKVLPGQFLSGSPITELLPVPGQLLQPLQPLQQQAHTVQSRMGSMWLDLKLPCHSNARILMDNTNT